MIYTVTLPRQQQFAWASKPARAAERCRKMRRSMPKPSRKQRALRLKRPWLRVRPRHKDGAKAVSQFDIAATKIASTR